MDDIMDELSGDDGFLTPTDSTTTTAATAKENDDINYWETAVIPTEDMDTTKMGSLGLSFVVSAFPRNDLPDNVIEQLVKVAAYLVKNGYTFRHTGSADNKLQNEILKIPGINVETFLPWKGYNKDIKTPEMTKPTPKGYRITAGLHRAFTKLPNAVRAIISRDLHSVIGAKCNDKTSLVLCYTTDGSEAWFKGIDFKVMGDVMWYIEIATKASVPIINLGKDGSIARIKELVESSTKKD